MSKVDKLISDFKKENPDVPVYLVDELEKSLENYKVSDKELGVILSNLKKEYIQAQITPYENIGVITAQSVGEPATQMTLNTFHFAGVESLNVTTGLPRIIEILDAKKNISSPLMWVYLIDSKNKEKAKNVAMLLKENRVRDVIENIDLDLEENILKLTFDLKILENLKVKISSVETKIKKLDFGEISLGSNFIEIKMDSGLEIQTLNYHKEQVLDVIVAGIKGIKDAAIITRSDEFVIQCKGSSLTNLKKFADVDLERSYSNDVFEVQKNFGIEAARNVIYSELENVVEEQGLDVNIRHLMMLADTMTYKGNIKGITRFGIIADKLNVLTKAAFETSIKHISRGALFGVSNKLTSITENVMTNQVTNVGTGVPNIKVKRKE